MSGTPFVLSTSATGSGSSAGSIGAATSGIPTLGGIWPKRNPSGGAISGNAGCGNYNPMNPADHYLNPNAFVTPSLFTFGDTLIPSNVRTCGWKNEDLTIQKTFPIMERVKTEFGADMFNVFNRHNWYGLQTNVSIPQTYGQYTAASDPRTIQFHLRVEF
jgi:hypothetical protein